jgi:hypothetical protein
MKDFDLEKWTEEEHIKHEPINYLRSNLKIAGKSALRAGFNKAKELYEPRWISVEEALPEKDDLVVIEASNALTLCVFKYGVFCDLSNAGTFRVDHVTRWYKIKETK